MIRRIDRDSGRVFQVYGKRAGKKVYLGTFTDRRLAIAADEDHRSKQRRIAAGELPAGHDDKRTFGVASKLWIAALKAVKSRSADEYEHRLANHMWPALANVPIVDIGKQDVIQWRDDLSTRVAAGSYVNNLLGTLSSAFGWFVEQRWLERNPCQGVKKLIRPQRVFPWLQSSEQITRLLSECPPHIQTIIAVLVGTGMRIDSALHLHWDDIDLEHRLITIHRGRKGMPKGGKLYRVPIFDSVMPVLKAMRLARGDNKMLWPGQKPGKAKAHASVYKPFKAAVKRAGLDERMRVHDLRHSFASLFLLDGGDIFKLSRILGHSSVTITEKTYAHLRPDAYQEDYGRVRFEMPRESKVLQFGVDR